MDFIPTKRELLDPEDTYCLRGIAMLLIIVSHAFNGYPTTSAEHFFPQWLNFLHMDLWGGMGVDVFFLLSGYGLFITLSSRKVPDGEYIIRKMKRLLIPFIIYWIVEFIVLLIFDRTQLTPHLFREIATFSIHPDVENWFFKVIVGIYVMMIMLFSVNISQRTRIGVIGLISVAYLLIMMQLGMGNWWYKSILCFPLGAIIAYKKDWFESLNPILVIVFTGVLMTIAMLMHRPLMLFHTSFALMAICLIRYFNIRNRLLGYIGFNSFIFYFMECPVLDEIMMFAYSNFFLYTVLSLAGTFLLSALCVRLQERF